LRSLDRRAGTRGCELDRRWREFGGERLASLRQGSGQSSYGRLCSPDHGHSCILLPCLDAVTPGGLAFVEPLHRHGLLEGDGWGGQTSSVEDAEPAGEGLRGSGHATEERGERRDLDEGFADGR
jgi:hypothetical protein